MEDKIQVLKEPKKEEIGTELRTSSEWDKIGLSMKSKNQDLEEEEEPGSHLV